MSVVAPEGRVLVREALPSLGLLAMFVVAWGIVKMVDQVARAFFGTVEGAVGWIPFAGRLVKHSLHKIEQKISHILGSAERGIDAHIATSFHKLATIVRQIPSQLVDQAGLIFGVTAALVLLPSQALVRHLIRVAVKPLWRFAREHSIILRHHGAQVKALDKSVAQGVYPRLKVIEREQTHVIERVIPSARAQAREAEAQAIAAYKWLVKHRSRALVGALTGVVAFALTRLGGGWIRCANWRKLGRAVCRTPSPIIDALIAALLAEFALANLRTLAQFAEAVEEDAARAVAALVGVAVGGGGRFTVE